ncbi:uncharacterized protein LOC116020161 [Ipomoea triloba]|uniref:uncharacterized protein LOC116020161 n=1 Tax=Ipomoea triloba TaxID=35885 RepID=UPI00125D2673|nr:uncharacterized protein LOC116020161 [Ipomoea triloba]
MVPRIGVMPLVPRLGKAIVFFPLYGWFPMKLISWNYRGVVNGRVKKNVKELLSTSKADALCLLEIRSPNAKGMINVANNLGYTNHFIVEPISFTGDLLLFWKHSLLDLEVIAHTSQAIHTRVKQGIDVIFVTFAYARLNILAKNRFWDNCKVVGGLNDIGSVDEQWGSDSVNNASLQRFVNAYSNCGLIDPGCSGLKFTWSRTTRNRVIQMRRFDRVLRNVDAQLAFPERKVLVLPRLCSDHNLMVFMDVAGTHPNNNLRPKCFEAAWLTREDYGTISSNATRSRDRSIEDVIWNQNVFGNIFKNKRHLEARILGIQQTANYTAFASLQALEKCLTNELSEILDQEEALWFRKSRKDRICDGDCNTRFYHNTTMIRRNKNRV